MLDFVNGCFCESLFFVNVTFTLKWVDWGQANYTTECDTSLLSAHHRHPCKLIFIWDHFCTPTTSKLCNAVWTKHQFFHHHVKSDSHFSFLHLRSCRWLSLMRSEINLLRHDLDGSSNIGDIDSVKWYANVNSEICSPNTCAIRSTAFDLCFVCKY